jgi:hypothetical protein
MKTRLATIMSEFDRFNRINKDDAAYAFKVFSGEVNSLRAQVSTLRCALYDVIDTDDLDDAKTTAQEALDGGW